MDPNAFSCLLTVIPWWSPAVIHPLIPPSAAVVWGRHLVAMKSTTNYTTNCRSFCVNRWVKSMYPTCTYVLCMSYAYMSLDSKNGNPFLLQLATVSYEGDDTTPFFWSWDGSSRWIVDLSRTVSVHLSLSTMCPNRGALSIGVSRWEIHEIVLKHEA